ncbi:hypothetical protein HK105_202169 [Polyrhizophydium stewartii]|uniref:MIT domain-containing protein n=1 Tax=Polyrhizophydium stewartii TaxID=2732419 RepID=A0ABR4NFD4_9FUNG
MDDSPAQKANAFASAAEEFTARGNLLKAVEAHFRAAEQYLLAMNDTSDPEAVKTLKLLYASHTRSGKELQRRVQQPPAAVSAPPQQQPISTSPSAMPGHLGEIGGSVPARSSPSPAPTPPQSALSSSPASGVSVLSRSSMPHSATTPPSGLPQALAAAQQQRRPGAIHLYSNTAATGPGSTSAAGSSPTPAAATAPGLAGTTPQSTHIATLAADLAESSILGSRQFFVGQSQSDSTILPTRTRAAAQQQSLLGGPSFGPGGIQISGGAHTAGQVSRAAPSSGTPQYHTQHRFSAEPATVPVKSLDQSDSVSSQSIAHSYLMLDENAKEIRRDDEPEDPFNKFWEAVEGLVQKISVSAPVAFTTVPLQGERRPLSADLAVKRASSFTDETRDPATNPPSQYSQPQQYATLPPSGRQSQTKRVEGIVQGSPTDLHDPMQSTAILQSYLLVPSDVPLVQSPHGAPLSQAALQRAGSFSSHTRRESSLGSLDEAKG